MLIPLNALKVNTESWVTILTHQIKLGTRQPSGPPWSVSIGTEILIHDPTIQGNLGRLWVQLSHNPLNPWIGKFCSFPSIENLPSLTQFHYWSVGNETNFLLHGKIFCGLLWHLKWPLKGSEGFKFEPSQIWTLALTGESFPTIFWLIIF